MRYEFRPNKKKSGRNQSVGKWEESKYKLIPLPFTIESLRTILNCGKHPENSEYTHQEIAHWCDLMHMKFIDTDESPDFDRAISIAADVDCQWDLYLKRGQVESAGINRHRVGDARALRERRSCSITAPSHASAIREEAAKR